MADQEIRLLEENDYFGEVSLIHDSVRTATVKTKNYCTLGMIALETLFELTSSYPFFKETLMEKMFRYDDQLKIFLMTSLRNIPYLADCSDDTIQAIAFSMKFDWLEPGVSYFNPGETQECLSIV